MQTSTRFQSKIVIITGAASGIGLATAKRLGSEGATLVLCDLNEGKLAEAVLAVKAAGAPDAIAQICDVSNEEQVIQAVKTAIDRFQKVDVIVNNAGLMIFKKLEEHTRDDWFKVLNVDLMGAFYFTKAAFLNMKGGGTIVNISSVHAVETTPLVASYAAAKAAILSLTRSASIEGKEKGIRVNAIMPGAIETPMLRENPNIKTGLEVINQNDVGRPEDIAAAVAFLASGDSEFISGDGLRVDGGRLARL